MKIELFKGDITRLNVDAIVNAANNSLSGGGGVDGAIHEAAGPELLEECRLIGHCPTGEVKITRGFNLPAAWVIHTVGPIWRGGDQNEASLLASCYANVMKVAAEKGFRSIAIPNISTGVYSFPKKYAAEIAIKEVRNALELNKNIIKVIFVCFDSSNYHIYREQLFGP
jgi:O-acetyl-ADP-ribose deacetylase